MPACVKNIKEVLGEKFYARNYWQRENGRKKIHPVDGNSTWCGLSL